MSATGEHSDECEGLTRTNATGGIVWITMTPLLQSLYDECGDGSA